MRGDLESWYAAVKAGVRGWSWRVGIKDGRSGSRWSMVVRKVWHRMGELLEVLLEESSLGGGET